jgi:hypothetical protein
MSADKQLPPLKPLHSADTLVPSKLLDFDRLSTEVLLQSLALGQQGCLKTRKDGTIIDGHHRIHVLRKRNVEVDMLPREIVVKEDF